VKLRRDDHSVLQFLGADFTDNLECTPQSGGESAFGLRVWEFSARLAGCLKPQKVLPESANDVARQSHSRTHSDGD